MRPFIKQVLDGLLASKPREITLDELGNAIGANPITQDEIDTLLTLLEEAGCAVGGATPNVRGHLHQVLHAARVLRELNVASGQAGASAGTAPGVAEIAKQAGLSTDEVRAALRYAQVLSR